MFLMVFLLMILMLFLFQSALSSLLSRPALVSPPCSPRCSRKLRWFRKALFFPQSRQKCWTWEVSLVPCFFLT